MWRNIASRYFVFSLVARLLVRVFFQVVVKESMVYISCCCSLVARLFKQESLFKLWWRKLSIMFWVCVHVYETYLTQYFVGFLVCIKCFATHNFFPAKAGQYSWGHTNQTIYEILCLISVLWFCLRNYVLFFLWHYLCKRSLDWFIVFFSFLYLWCPFIMVLCWLFISVIFVFYVSMILSCLKLFLDWQIS